jgi:hypothetical protein
MLWTRYFIEAQDYKLEKSILNQDNMSAMLPEAKGKESSSKRTKHISVRYFFFKDRVQAGEITIKHCPTNDMLADHITKPVQGTHFRKLRSEIKLIPENALDALMGWDRPGIRDNADYKPGSPSPQECVGTHVNRTNVTRKDTGNEISLSTSGKILTTHCGVTRKSYVTSARGAVRLPRPIRHHIKMIEVIEILISPPSGIR